MFDPTGKAKITMHSDDGTTYEMDGFIRSFAIESDHGVDVQAGIDFIGSGPAICKGEFVPDAITTPIIQGGGLTIRDGPDGVVIGLALPYRPWSWEASMLVGMGLVAVVTWAVLRAVFEWIL